MKPYSDNIIFWDTEFSSLNPYEGELLSLAFVKPTGEELYIELEHEGPVDPWVVQNVMPTLTAPKISRDEAITKMFEFFGSNRPYLVSYVNQFDTIYLFKLLKNQENTKNYPFHWISIDMASMMFGSGLNPESFSGDEKDKLLAELKIDVANYSKHNALSDARLLRDTYLKLLKR